MSQKKWYLLGTAAAMALLGGVYYYAALRETEGLPPLSRIRRLVREVKRQVFYFCILFVKNTRDSLKQEPSEALLNQLAPQFKQVLGNIYQSKLKVLLAKKDIGLDAMNECLRERGDLEQPDIQRDMQEVNDMLNRAARLELPNNEVPQEYQGFGTEQLETIAKEVLASSTVLILPLFKQLSKDEQKVDYMKFLRAMDHLDLQMNKTRIYRKHGWPVHDERCVEYFSKLDESYRRIDPAYEGRMAALEKIYEKIVELGMSNNLPPDSDSPDWVQAVYDSSIVLEEAQDEQAV